MEHNRSGNPGVYHVDMHIEQILGNEMTAAVFDSVLPGMRKCAAEQQMIAGMSVRKLAEYSKGAITDSALDAMNAELNKIPADHKENSTEEQLEALKGQPLTKGAAEHYEPDKYQVSPEEQKELMSSSMLESANTSVADYVWLLLVFDGDRVYIKWEDEWKIEDYN